MIHHYIWVYGLEFQFNSKCPIVYKQLYISSKILCLFIHLSSSGMFIHCLNLVNCTPNCIRIELLTQLILFPFEVCHHFFFCLTVSLKLVQSTAKIFFTSTMPCSLVFKLILDLSYYFKFLYIYLSPISGHFVCQVLPFIIFFLIIFFLYANDWVRPSLHQRFFDQLYLTGKSIMLCNWCVSFKDYLAGKSIMFCNWCLSLKDYLVGKSIMLCNWCLSLKDYLAGKNIMLFNWCLKTTLLVEVLCYVTNA